MPPPIPATSGSTFPAAGCAGGSRSAGRNCTGRSRPCSAPQVPGLRSWISSLPRPHQCLIFPNRRADRRAGGRRRPRPARKPRLFRRHPAPGNAPVRARAQGTLPQASGPRARASGRLRPRPGNGRIVFRNALSGTGLAECPMKSKRGTTACHFHNAVIDALQYGSASDVPPHIRLLSAGSALGSVEW